MFSWNHTEIRLPCWQVKGKFKDVEEVPLHGLELLRIKTKIGGEFSEVVKDIM